MANRVLRDWTQSETVNDLSEGAEVFFTRLIMKADDFGCYYGNAKLLLAALFPLKDYNFNKIIVHRDECQNAGLIKVYKHQGKEYVQIVNFGQRLRQMNSKFPQPENIPQTDDSNPLPNDSQQPPETKRNETEDEVEEKRIIVIGEKKYFHISIKSKYITELPIIIYDLKKYFEGTAQLEALLLKKWNRFDDFMKENPANVFEDATHLYNAFRNFHTKTTVKNGKNTNSASATSGGYAGKL